MTPGLLAGIAGLALVDSVNPATIAGVALILLSPLRRPVPVALAYVLGAYATVLLVGTLALLGADAAAGAFDDGLVWVRRGALGLAALALAVTGLRRLRARQRGPVELPRWFSARTAAPVAVLVTAADLPNAFPYFVAIERLLAADVALPAATAVLAAYAVVYCLPCLLLLGAGVLWGERIRGRLDRVYQRLGRARTVPRSYPAALGLLGAAGAVAWWAATG